MGVSFGHSNNVTSHQSPIMIIMCRAVVCDRHGGLSDKEVQVDDAAKNEEDKTPSLLEQEEDKTTTKKSARAQRQ